MEITYGFDKQVYTVLHYDIIDDLKAESCKYTIKNIKYKDAITEYRADGGFYYFKKARTGRNTTCTLSIYSKNEDGTNLYPITEQELEKRIKKAICELKTNYGIEILEKDLKPYTSEINVNFKLDEKFSEYNNRLFPGIADAIKKHNNNYKVVPASTGFSISSTSGAKTYKIYDKRAEMLENDDIRISDEIVRFEQETNLRKRKDVSIVSIKESEIIKEIYNQMLYPYIKELEYRQKQLDKLYQEFQQEYEYISKTTRKEFINRAFSSDVIDVVDILEPIYCIYRNTDRRNRSRLKKQLQQLYKEMYNKHNFTKYNNHKRFLDMVLAIKYPVSDVIQRQIDVIK